MRSANGATPPPHCDFVVGGGQQPGVAPPVRSRREPLRGPNAAALWMAPQRPRRVGTPILTDQLTDDSDALDESDNHSGGLIHENRH